jgi:hypothetical protein
MYNVIIQGSKMEDDKSVDYNDDADLLTDFFFTDADLKEKAIFITCFLSSNFQFFIFKIVEQSVPGPDCSHCI